jgi:hypothetical protein
MHLSETFTVLSAHLGNLFVAIGSAELSNKMLLYMTYEEVKLCCIIVVLGR